jgi:hypothetical protein
MHKKECARTAKVVEASFFYFLLFYFLLVTISSASA